MKKQDESDPRNGYPCRPGKCEICNKRDIIYVIPRLQDVVRSVGSVQREVLPKRIELCADCVLADVEIDERLTRPNRPK